MKINDSHKLLLKVIAIMVVFYILLMLAWNFTNTNHKPSSILWDWRREGYTDDPLRDRKQINN